MARLLTAGAESQSPQAENLTPTGTVAIDTTNPRTGKAAFSIATANSFNSFTFTGAVSTSYYARAYVRASADPTVVAGLLFFATGAGALLGEADLNTDGRVSLRLNGTSILTTTNPIPTGQYTLIELEASYPASGAATLTLSVNGAVVGSGAGSSTLPGGVGFGHKSASAPGATLLFDDMAVNDSTGAAENSWCGPGSVVMLFPVSDAARTGWTDGAGGTTALFDAMNNAPPAGVAAGSISATSQIKDGNANATDTYQANVGAYSDPLTSGGGALPSNAIVTLVQAVANGAHAGSVAAYTKAVSGISNPAATEGTGSGSSTAAAAYPTNWSSVFSAVVYAPSVTLTTKPVVQIRKGLANVNAEYYDLVALIVEYTVPASLTATAATSVSVSSSCVVASARTRTASASASVTTAAVSATQTSRAASATVAVSMSAAVTRSAGRAASTVVTESNHAARAAQPASRTTSATVTVSGAAAANSSRARTTTGSITVSTAAARATATDRAASGSVSIGTQATNLAGASRTAGDSLTVTGATVVGVGVSVICGTTVTVTTSAGRAAAGASRSNSALVSVVGGLARSVSTTRTAGDSLTIASTASEHAARSRSCSDSIAVDSAASRGTVIHGRSVVASVTILSAVAHFTPFARSALTAISVSGSISSKFHGPPVRTFSAAGDSPSVWSGAGDAPTVWSGAADAPTVFSDAGDVL